MSVSETVLYFVVTPLVIVLVITGLVMLTSHGAPGGGGKRYRPGRPFEFTPVWFVSSADQITDPEQASRKTLPGGVPAPAIQAGRETESARTRAGATGGASDRW